MVKNSYDEINYAAMSIVRYIDNELLAKYYQ